MTKPIRCAIYTRKSSEEGLEQDFNSLHAQREACEAFITSQKHEGWKLLPQAYDDGGISGGTMQRPALQRLLKAVEERAIDVIVVYKVDRLTRSLADFARMVELFDQHGVSFVSVTQQFNTTTSMGRLTLNVLLSFAQFEREVTSERIRDKVKASKAKGMWMGGNVPFGYRVEDRKLIVDTNDSETLRTIFRQYVEVGTITRLIARLKEMGTGRLDRHGRPTDFTRGGLQTLLANPIYIGKVRHGKVLHDGQHEAIVDMALWESVQEQFRINSQGSKWRERVTKPLPLLGKLYDAEMRRLVGSHTVKKGRRYRFYISESLRREADPTGWRLPAAIIEDKVSNLIRLMLKDGVAITGAAYGAGIDPAYIKTLIAHASEVASKWSLDKLVKELVGQVHIHADQISVELNVHSFLPKAAKTDQDTISIRRQFPAVLRRRGVEMRLVMNATDYRAPNINQQLVSTIAKGHVWFDDWLQGKIKGYRDIVEREGISASYAGDVMKLAFLSPALVEDIIQGRQPDGLMVSHLTKVEDMPLRWEDQAAQYEWT